MKIIILTAALLFSAFVSMAIQPSDSLKSNSKQTLPDITLKDVDGNNVNIQTYGANGKITIVSFWATWCKPCLKELKNIDALLEDWTAKYNVELVAVSIDNARNTIKVKPTVTGNSWEFPVLLDPNGELQRALNATNPPYTLLVDQKGNIVYTHTGYLEGDEYDLEKEIQKLVK